LTEIGAIAVAYFYIYDDPYYNKTVGDIFKVLSFMYLWTCTVLFLLKIIESWNFQGGLVLLLVPMPFIYFIARSF
jgi:hypothetical protein